MQCCVPFCETTAEIGSESAGITFHEFPREVQLRAAWLRALGKQDSRLPDSAVVCSLHFLNDDIYETANGLRQLRTGAIPSTLQVCMICLDTDVKMLLMSKHKLDEAYEQLTNHPPYDLKNLKQTLCVQCAQRLINFSQFRDKSLKARRLMMDLVEQHKLITRQHITMINRTKHRLNSDTVSTKLEPDHYELHIPEQLSEDIKIEIEETVNRAAVKTEGSCGSTSGDEDKEVIVKDDRSISDDVIKDPLKCESAPFHCTLCLEEFVHEHAYMRHMTMHLQAGRSAAAAARAAALAIHSDTFRRPAARQLDEPATSAHPARTATATATTTTTTTSSAHPACTVAASSASLATTNENNVTSLKREPALDTSNGGAPIRAGHTTVDIDALTRCAVKLHYDVHTKVKQFTCKICQYKCNRQHLLTRHMRTHTGERPYACDFCGHKCAEKSNLAQHMRTHTGHSCKLCSYKFAKRSDLVEHMRAHTGEMPHSCELCDYKFAERSNLVAHMRTHTGERPYACELCSYKFTERNKLVIHMRTHTGERPYACELCGYKCARKGDLARHTRTHTGEKPHSCELCSYKSATRSDLVKHMRTHTGEKPHSCELCGYKSATRSDIVKHMRTHTGEKPHSFLEAI